MLRTESPAAVQARCDAQLARVDAMFQGVMDQAAGLLATMRNPRSEPKPGGRRVTDPVLHA